MKRFEIPEITDDMYSVTIKYFNNLENPNSYTDLIFYTTLLSQKALVTLTKACQTIYDQAGEFGKTQNYPKNRYFEGFTNSELKKLQKEDPEATVNHVIFSVAVTLQEVTTSIFDATSDPNTPIPTLISNILSSLNSAFSLKNTLKILDKDKLAPNTLTKNNIAMAKNLRDALKDITSVASVIFEEYTDEDFLAEQDIATRTGIKIAASLVRKIYDFTKTSHDNLEIAIKAYEIKLQASAKTVAAIEVATAAPLAEEEPSKRNLAEIAKNMTYPQVQERIIELKDQIQKKRKEAENIEQTLRDFEAYSIELQKNLREPNKENAKRLMEILSKTNPNQALVDTCNMLKKRYDGVNPKKEHSTPIAEKLAGLTKAFRKKSSAVLKPQKQQDITAHYDNLWAAVVNHVNGNIKENKKSIDSINNKMQEDEEELMFLQSVRKPHIFTKAFWVNLWNTIRNRLFGPADTKSPTTPTKTAKSEEKSSVSKDDEPLEGATFKSSAYSKPVGAPKFAAKEKTDESIELEMGSEDSQKPVKKK